MLLKVNTQVSIKIIRFGTGNINTHWGVKHKKSPLLPIDHLFSDPVCGASQPSSQHRLAERVADHIHRWARFPNWNRHFHVLLYSIIPPVSYISISVQIISCFVILYHIYWWISFPYQNVLFLNLAKIHIFIPKSS